MAALRSLGPLEFGPAATAAGREWIRLLPELLGTLAAGWRLEVDGERIWHGFQAVVVPVRRDDRPLVLKLSYPPDPARAEALALGVWGGHGAVQLLESEPDSGALLLERLDPSRRLDVLTPPEAAAVAGRLIRALAVKAPSSVPPLASAAREIAVGLRAAQRRAGVPVPSGWLGLAADVAEGLSESTAGLMVHADLHYANVLAGEREPWLAVDPKAFRGEPERSVAELLWTRADELADAVSIRGLFDVVVNAGELDRDRAALWAFTRAIDYWVWGLDNGLTIDPGRCHRVADAMAPIAVRV